MDAYTALQLFLISRLVACSLAFACCAWCFITGMRCPSVDTPYPSNTVFETKKGTQVLTHSPNARH